MRDLAGDLVIHRLILFVYGRETLGQIARLAAFLQGLQQLGWIDGRNARIDTRSAAGNSDYTRKYLAELLTLAPDVILAAGSQSVGPLLQTTRAVPIVFVHVPDPVGAGFVASLARPGGNATGFTFMEYSTSGKWLELLKEIAPGVTRVAVVGESAITGGIGQRASIQSMAPSVGVEVIPVNMPDAAEIERSVMAFARGANGGLVLTASGSAFVHHGLIIALARRPAGAAADQIRVRHQSQDRQALGLAVPPALLAAADEVIE